jgi:GT2 family glycosyltransferase
MKEAPMIGQPKLSVITAVLDSVDSLADCLGSVAAQQGVEAEHLVIDGGSTDGTVELLEQWGPRLAYWSSGVDTGIAEAMNKGIEQARGEWLLFLQGDDFLADPHVLRQALDRCSAQDDICAFPIQYGSRDNSTRLQPRGNSLWLNCKNGFNHQATLIRRSLFSRIGGYDTRFKIAMDYEFFLRAHRQHAQVSVHRAPTLSFMGDAGITGRRDWPTLSRRFAEERQVHALHQLPGMQPLYAAFWGVYLGYRRGLNLLGRPAPSCVAISPEAGNGRAQ